MASIHELGMRELQNRIDRINGAVDSMKKDYRPSQESIIHILIDRRNEYMQELWQARTIIRVIYD